MVASLEMLLAHRLTPAECVAGLDQLQDYLNHVARRKRRRNWLIVLGVVLAFVAFIIFAATTFR